MKAKTSLFMTVLGVLVCGNAISADYAVGIVNLGSGLWYGGTGVNLYSITGKGVDLVQEYVFPENDYTGKPASPLRLSINPEHDFVYIAYTGLGIQSVEPILAAFMITPKGLVYQWRSQMVTGDPTLQGTTLTAGRDYVIENTFPDAVDLWVEIYNKSGRHIVQDLGATEGSDGGGLISGHVADNGKFYYSCRDVPATYPVTPANTVLVYELKDDRLLDTSLSRPMSTSTDAVFVANVCVPTPPRFGDPGNDPG